MSGAWIWTLSLTTAAIAISFALWALLWDRPRGRMRCPRCWYSLVGHALPATCPECGRNITKTRQMLRTRRRWRVAMLALLIVAATGWIAPVVATKGWVAAVPQPALDVAIGAVFADEAAAVVASTSVPRSDWKQALMHWEVRRRLRTFALAPEYLGRTLNADEHQEASHLLDCAFILLMSDRTRSLTGSMALLAERTSDPWLREYVLRVLIEAPAMSRSKVVPLWRLAAVTEDPLSARLVEAILSTDPACPDWSNTEAALKWFKGTLAKGGLSDPVWRRFARKASRFHPSAVPLVESAIRNRPGAIASEAAAEMHTLALRGINQHAIYPALHRLLDHPDPQVRRECVLGLSYGVTVYPAGLDAIRRCMKDEDAGVVSEARLALLRHGEFWKE